ncbi:MAG: family 20 glycosylhydrolase [Tannerella sp.]|nr:family 20 glycosylhydrolase [Tannerella sp.]
MTSLVYACGESNSAEVKPYNKGINIIPKPQSLVQNAGEFALNARTAFYANTEELQKVAEPFAAKIRQSTGFAVPVNATGQSSNVIALVIDGTLDTGDEGYTLDVTAEKVTVRARRSQGLFYGLQTFLQLLPAEIESAVAVADMTWSAPCVAISDRPRFGYRGIMLDPCRHFMSVDDVKKQLDVLALFKINRMHWHLTDDQGWRIEIKKYPRLTEIGSVRTEGEGTQHGGYYTQEQIREVVAYAAERFITVIPEIEIPGHEMAAIAAYPELTCKAGDYKPRILWGVEDIVLCAGKESTFEFFEDVFKEVVGLFPSEYVHIGGDECPKVEWKQCPLCQKRIREEGLQARDGHSAEERLQSYFVQRVEKILAKYNKKIIGWDEILEGGLAPTATVMSWRGEQGGIAAASLDHDVIMTPNPNGMYIDQFQGDSKIEPVSIGGYTTPARIYFYNPVPDTLVEAGKAHYIKGVQCNSWSEYMYTNDIREYRIYPRILALAEIAWTTFKDFHGSKTGEPASQADIWGIKDYRDFEQRLNNACVRLDGHNINYHIPQPEQPGGSCNFVAFTDRASLEFTATRPVRMVYTTDGSEPAAESATYETPLEFTETGVLKIRSVLSSGRMSAVRTIQVEKQALSPASAPSASPVAGLKMKVTDGMYLKVSDIPADAVWKEQKIKSFRELTSYVKSNEAMRGVKQYAAIATGYIEIPADGVYFFSSDLEEVWIDGQLLINNVGEVKRFSRHDRSMALAAGLHSVKAVFLGHVIGGWPSNWNDGSISVRRTEDKKFGRIQAEQLYQP